MLWPEVTPLLAIAAGFVVGIAFIAILLTEIGRKDEKTAAPPTLDRSSLPTDADLSNEERRRALYRFTKWRDASHRAR